MKFYSIVLAGLAAINAEETAITPAPRKLGQVKDMLAIKTGMSTQDAKNFLRNYGCYCYPLFAQKVGSLQYNGEPVDELDDLCKKLYRAQKCIQIDVDNGRYEQDCSLDQGYGFFEEDGDFVCGAEENQDQMEKYACRINMCELEKDFASKVAALVDSGFERNLDFRNMDEDSYAASCPRIPNGGGSDTELACCGNGLARKTYNTLTSVCCDGTRVESFGSC